MLRVVYDVANRESFDALPRWYRELETYVSESVVKILVGNKVDKVRSLVPVRFHRLRPICTPTRIYPSSVPIRMTLIRTLQPAVCQILSTKRDL